MTTKTGTPRRRFAAACITMALLAGCGSVEVPSERLYRLQLPATTAPNPLRAGTLRVCDLTLGTALDGDRLLWQDGVRLEARPLARWVAPLDRLVTDALVLGLSRRRVCELVKGSGDAGPETWTLHGRIVDFVEADGPGGSEARVALELWLERDGELLFHDEFGAAEPLRAADPATAEEAVLALSRGVDAVVAEVVARMESLELFAAERARRDAATAARPPR